MDMMRKKAPAGDTALEDLQTYPKVTGVKQLRKAVLAGQVIHAFLAMDADPFITQPLADLCRQYQVKCTWVADMRTLGRACGIRVGAAAAGAVAEPSVLPGKPEE